MSFQDDLEFDVSETFLNADNEEFAGSVTQWPQGVELNATSVVAVVSLKPRRKELETGERYVVRGTVDVSPSVTLHQKDCWIIGSKRYDTESIDEERLGIVTVNIYRWETDTRRPGGTWTNR
jgi:hypothetical protein